MGLEDDFGGRVLLCYPIDYLNDHGLPFNHRGTCAKCGAEVGHHESSPQGLPLVCTGCYEGCDDGNVMITERQIRALVKQTGDNRDHILEVIESVFGKKVLVVEDVV